MDYLKLERCLYSQWNGSATPRDAATELNKLLPRKKAHSLLREVYQQKQSGACKDIPHRTFLLTCALLRIGKEKYSTVFSALQRLELVKMLSIGFGAFLCNRNKKSQLVISWTDNRFPNLHRWISRFSGRFEDQRYRDLLDIAHGLYALDADGLWQIAKDDPNDLILLNWGYVFGDNGPIHRLPELLDPAQSIRRQAIAFWWRTFPIQLRRENEEEASAILAELSTVPDQVLFPRVYEFFLVERRCPASFQSYLLKPSRHRLFLQELSTGKLRPDWSEVTALGGLIHKIRNRRQRDHCWRLLMDDIKAHMRSGRFIGTIEQSIDFWRLFPEDCLEAFRMDLISWRKTLHTASIDSIIRPQIFHSDMMQLQKIQQLLEITAPSSVDTDPNPPVGSGPDS